VSLSYEERTSLSPFIERIWHSHSEYAGSFASIAATHWEIVVTKYEGKTTLTVRGPETKATHLEYPAGAEWVGIDFKLGTYMPHFPPKSLVNFNDVNLPNASSQSFWLQGSAWQFPTYENVDTFVDRLVCEGLLVHDPVVETILAGHPQALKTRAIQGRFLRATGLPLKVIQQIKRARHAAVRLGQGAGIIDTAYEAGYFDQSHLTRALKHFIGFTPANILGTPLISLGKNE
jgi:AraC-like DNA-binding protein